VSVEVEGRLACSTAKGAIKMRESGSTQGESFKFRRLVPTPATVLSAIALLFAMAGGAVAADRINRDEVTVVTTTGGPVDVIQTDDPVAVPLVSPSFTQKAGEAVMVTAQILVSYPGRVDGSHGCDVFVDLFDSSNSGEAGFEMRRLWERGAFGDPTGTTGLPAPASDTIRTLTAEARLVTGGFSCAGNPDEWVYRVSVRVSIVTYRN